MPVAIAGTSDILPLGFIFRKKGPIVITVGDLIPTASYDVKSYDQLVLLVREQLVQLQKRPERFVKKFPRFNLY